MAEDSFDIVIVGAGFAGSALAIHLARAICRRAERSAVTADADVGLNPIGLAYINRLSDHLFVLARWLNRAGPGLDGSGDILWKPGATR